MALTSELLSRISGIEHGFGTREEPLPEFARTTWDSHRPQWKQVHGVAVCDVKQPQEECGEVDALYSGTPGIPIAVMTADCVPVLLARKDGSSVAAVHAGWKGTVSRILRSLWLRLEQQGEKPADWVAAIGPAIGPCCYEVSEELAGRFKREFPDMAAEKISPGHRMLDLPAINEEELKAIGVKEIDVLRACTRCSREGGAPLFNSYRREGSGMRQWSVIRVKAR